MFARYSQPKMMPKFNSQEQEEKFFASFVVVADRAGRQLPAFSEAFCGLRTKRFFDPGTGMQSSLVGFYAALLGSKATKEQIASEAFEEPDLDDLIGYPLYLYVDPSTKIDKHGIFTNRVNTNAGGFEPADAALKKIAAPIYKDAEFNYTTDHGLRYLVRPASSFEDETSGVAPADDVSLDEIPF